jgi:mercuric ion transport protein
MKKENLLLGATAAGAILATTCCVLPFTLFSIGISGAWLGNLASLAPYRPWFIGIALVLLAGGIYVIRKKRITAACAPEGYCESTIANKVQMSILVISAIVIATAIVWPVLLPLVLGPTT